MVINNIETLVTNIYQMNEKIKSICLLKADGTISLFLSKNDPIDEGEKKRLTASIMASIVLAERSIINLVQEHVNHVVIKGEHAQTIIFMTKNNNYVYFLTELDFDYKSILNIEIDF